MNYLTTEELVTVRGGAISSSMINAVTKAVSTLFSLGQAVGSALRRNITRNYC
jgi:hypothetical protein